VQPYDVPQRPEEDVWQRRMCVCELRDEPTVMIEIQRSRDVVSALVPVVRQAKQSEMANGDRSKEQKPD